MSHMKLCATQQRLEEVPETGFEQAGKLCVAQSGQAKLCAAQSGQGKALRHTIGTGEKEEAVLNKQDEKPSGAVAASK